MTGKQDEQASGEAIAEPGVNAEELQQAVDRATATAGSTDGGDANSNSAHEEHAGGGEPVAGETGDAGAAPPPVAVADTVSQAAPAAASVASTPDGFAQQTQYAAGQSPGQPAPQPYASSAATGQGVNETGGVQLPPNVQDPAMQQTASQTRAQFASLDTQLDMPSAGASPQGAPAAYGTQSEAAPGFAAPFPQQARDGEVPISPDHPMASLYMQTPMPPEPRGNRLAGFLISLLATIVFAVLAAGALALYLAPVTTAADFLGKAFLPNLLSLPFFAATGMFFVALTVAVVIGGRAGWWHYVLGGFLIGVAVFAAVVAAVWASEVNDFAKLNLFSGLERVDASSVSEIFARYSLVAVVCGVLAREVTVWFGAWIGARGRKVKQRNQEAYGEYERQLAEVQANTR